MVETITLWREVTIRLTDCITFHNEWQRYRLRKDRSLLPQAQHTYDEPGEYDVLVKVIDILGNDSTKNVRVRVG